MNGARILSPDLGEEKTLVVACPPARVRDVWRQPEALLSETERRRASAFHDGRDQASFVAAHALVRAAAAAIVGSDPREITIEQRCDQCGGPHGKPRVREHPQLSVSLSHTRTYVAAAASITPVAVDVEPAAREVDMRVAEQVLSKTELDAVLTDAEPRKAFLRHWVRRECLVKLGLINLQTPVAPADADEWTTHRWESDEAIGCSVSRSPVVLWQP